MRKHISMLLIIIVVLSLSIGYSALNTDLSISGEAIVRADNDIRITDIILKETLNGAIEDYNPKYTVDTTTSYVTLPSSSEIVYEITISNNTGKRIIVNDIVSTLSNENISYEISGLEINEVYSGNEIKFTLTIVNNSNVTQSGTINLEYDLEVFEGYIVTLVQNNEVLKNNISKDMAKVNYPVNTNNDIVLRCDYGSVPSIKDGMLTIDNISNDTTCSFYNNLENATSEANNSKNYLLMLNDYKTTKTISIAENQNFELDLNGKLIESSARTISNSGTLIVTDTSFGGTISNTGNNSQVIYNNGGNFTLNNGQIKSTESCDVWYCSSLFNINNSLVNIDPIIETSFNSDGSYKTGVYINQTYGIALWNHSGTVSNIYGGEYRMFTNSDMVSWQLFVCSTCDTLNIYDAHTIGEKYSSPIRGQQSGNINVYGGTFENPTSTRYLIATDADFDGTINLYGGTGIGGGSNIGIANTGVNSEINICNFTFENLRYDVGSNGGVIRYKDGVNWINGSSPTLYPGVNITLDNSLVCK